jgi:hypothetical protein
MEHIEITRTLFTVADFVSWSRAKQLNLSPSFQRRAVWKPQAKSYLIDTIVRGLPTPIIFLRQITDTKTFQTLREVVDGQQRLRTLISYIDPKALPDYKAERDAFTVRKTHNPEMASKTFSELDERLKKLILDYQFSTHILPNDTSDQQVLDIFRRMNATGTRLNWQELRNADFFGECIKSIYDTSLASLDLWRRWKTFSEDEIARMQEAEFVSELYILIMQGVSEKSQRLINRFYEQYDIHFNERAKVERRLNWLLEIIDESYGDAMAESNFSGRIVLYALVAALYDVSFGIGSPLTVATPKNKLLGIKPKLVQLNKKLDARDKLPEKVQDALISRPGSKLNRTVLTNFVKNTLARP